MIFLLIGFFLLSSCSKQGLAPKNTLTVVATNVVNSLNPLFSTDAAAQHINELTHAGLVTINQELLPEPYLAESMKIVNAKTIEFRLRKGCTFASGREIQTSDVEKSLNYFVDPKNASAFRDSLSRIKQFKKIDNYRFQFMLDGPAPSLLADLDLLKILDLDKTPAEKVFHITGAGPYELLEADASQITLKRRLQPCLPQPPMEKIRIKVVRDDLSRYLKLKLGEVDLVLNDMNFRKVEVIEKDPTLPMATLRGPGIGFSYLGLNMTNEKLRIPEVRRALALSLDVPALIQFKSRGMARRAKNILPDSNFYANKQIPLVERNLEEAKRLLDKAGFSNGSNGKPVLQLTLKTNTSSISVENARVMVAQAKEAGIELKHQANDWGIFYNDVKSGNTEIYILRWVGVTDPRIYFEAFHSGEIGKGNRTRYRNKNLDSLLEKAEAATDIHKRQALYWEVQKIVSTDLPYINLWHGENVLVYRKEVKNVSIHPAGRWSPLLVMRKE